MAITSKVAQATDSAGDAVSSVRSNPYLQRALNDTQLHDDVRSAVAAGKAIAEHLKSNRSAASKLTADNLYNELQSLAVAVRDAGEAIKSAPQAQKPRRGGFGKLLMVGIVGGIAAIALSESLRNKLLDALFGAEEEFQYTPASAVGSSNGASAAASAAAAPVAAAAPAEGGDESAADE